MTSKKKYLAAAACLTLGLAFSACSTKATSDDDAGSGGGLKTGPGVTDDTITLGSLIDLSGPAAAFGPPVSQGQQLYVDQVNAEGGICDRQLKVEIADSGYDPQKALTAYTGLKDKVATMSAVVGTPIVTALLDSFKQDEIAVYPVSWSSTLLGQDNVQVVGPTYDVDMLNGLSWLASNEGLQSGDKVGALTMEGEAGDSALSGLEFEADKLGLELVKQQMKPADQDMTAQITAFKQAGVKAIAMMGLPSHTASAVGVAAASGLNVPFLVHGTGWWGGLVDTPVGDALVANVHVVNPLSNFSDPDPAVQEVYQAFKKAHPKADISGVIDAYTLAAFTGEDLKKACADGDLSRAGILAAHRSLDSVDIGFGTTQDFSDPSRPSSTTSYLSEVDPKGADSLKLVTNVQSDDVEEYLGQ